MKDLNSFDEATQEIEQANGDVQFISMSTPEQPVDHRNIAEWFFDEMVKLFWLR